EAFCSEIRRLALSPPGPDIDATRIREVQQAFGELGDPPRFVLRKMLELGGLTLSQMGNELAASPERFVSDPVSVERVLAALKDRQFVQGDVEARWGVKPELGPVVRQCFDSPSLAIRMLKLSKDIVDWVDGLGENT